MSLQCASLRCTKRTGGVRLEHSKEPEPMTVAAVLKQKGSDVISVAPTATVAEIAKIIANRRIGAVVVLDEGRKLLGIVSERDVVKALANHDVGVLTLTAEQLMTREVVTAVPQTTLNQALQIMDAGYFRHLPVVENGVVTGIISVRDVVKYTMMVREHEVDSLKAYVSRAGGDHGHARL
jgi:CBS domain-containing protein